MTYFDFLCKQVEPYDEQVKPMLYWLFTMEDTGNEWKGHLKFREAYYAEVEGWMREQLGNDEIFNTCKQTLMEAPPSIFEAMLVLSKVNETMFIEKLPGAVPFSNIFWGLVDELGLGKRWMTPVLDRMLRLRLIFERKVCPEDYQTKYKGYM